ncbi:MAG: addiction module protein [Verrucomicrobiaceae bacterium]|mgnify:CR=1 FL=1|nr:addiction module protein [Verrucomicrobiaceae bacterium]
MSVEELALGLPRLEKLRLMEALWCDLSRHADTFESPAWHEDALKETEARLADGREAIYDWSEVKKILTGQR